MSRPSKTAFSVVSAPDPRPSRLEPPGDLTGPARALFADIVASHDSGHFRPCDRIPLANYCRAAIRAQRAAGEVDACPITDDGKPSPWQAILTPAVKEMLGLSRALRLSPLSRPGKGTKPSALLSYYERMQIEAADDAH
jgi:hypothetical protein